MRLQTYLTRNSISIEDFASSIEVASISTIYRYLRSERIPCSRVMERIRQLTGGVVTADDFFEARRMRRGRSNSTEMPA